MSIELIKSIANDQSLSKLDRRHELCKIDTFNHTTLGTDSTEAERQVVKEQQQLIDKYLKELE